jgi:hypothetical protein
METRTMALMTAYLARTAQVGSGRTLAAATRSLFGGLVKFVRVSGQAIAEARELERVMRRKYPFTDV